MRKIYLSLLASVFLLCGVTKSFAGSISPMTNNLTPVNHYSLTNYWNFNKSKYGVYGLNADNYLLSGSTTTDYKLGSYTVSRVSCGECDVEGMTNFYFQAPFLLRGEKYGGMYNSYSGQRWMAIGNVKENQIIAIQMLHGWNKGVDQGNFSSPQNFVQGSDSASTSLDSVYYFTVAKDGYFSIKIARAAYIEAIAIYSPVPRDTVNIGNTFTTTVADSLTGWDASKEFGVGITNNPIVNGQAKIDGTAIGCNLSNNSYVHALYTMKNMPEGSYDVGVSAIAMAKDKSSSTGVYWFANNDSSSMSTINSNPVCFSTTGQVGSDGILKFGVKTYNSDVNTLLFDNITLKYVGYNAQAIIDKEKAIVLAGTYEGLTKDVVESTVNDVLSKQTTYQAQFDVLKALKTNLAEIPANLVRIDSLRSVAYKYYINSIGIDSIGYPVCKANLKGDSIRKSFLEYLNYCASPDYTKLPEIYNTLYDKYQEYLTCEGIQPSQNLNLDTKEIAGQGIGNASFDKSIVASDSEPSGDSPIDLVFNKWYTYNFNYDEANQLVYCNGQGWLSQGLILPRTGKYTIKVQGFARELASNSQSFQNYNTSSDEIQSSMYVHTFYKINDSTKIDTAYICSFKNIFADASDSSLIAGDAKATVHKQYYNSTSKKWTPDTNEAAEVYFKKGLYTNQFTFDGVKGMFLRIQIDSKDNWLCLDNFSLLFGGVLPTVDHSQYGHDSDTDNTGNAGGTLTGIDGVSKDAAVKNIYTITGQKVNSDVNSLKKGLYIINGKKVIIK
jgi:hypothetical protein